MLKWLRSIFNPNPPQPAAAVDETGLLDLQRENQSLRLSLKEKEESLQRLKGEVERLRAGQSQQLNENLTARLAGLFGDVAAPASQLRTQADLLEKQGKPVQARDVLSVAQRLLRALERHGLAFDGQVGAETIFDPNQHTPLQSTGALQPGQPVRIRFSGVTYQGRRLYKAIVE